MPIDPPRRTLHRKLRFPKYKANRDKKDGLPEEVIIQSRRCKQVAASLGIPLLEYPGYEADDVIATLVDVCASDEVECVIASPDKDLNQLLGANCRQFDPQNEVWIDEQRAVDKWEVRVDQIVDVMSLAGDPTDNIPGVPGIGIATATKLIREFGSVEALLEHIQMGHHANPRNNGSGNPDRNSLTQARRQKIQAADMHLNRFLVELCRDVPITESVSDLEFNGLDYLQALPLFEELGFNSLLKKVS